MNIGHHNDPDDPDLWEGKEWLKDNPHIQEAVAYIGWNYPKYHQMDSNFAQALYRKGFYQVITSLILRL